MEKKDKKINEVMMTEDYGKFKTIKGNRVVDKNKVGRLITSMQEKQLQCPIIVNSKFEIIDGQHRFAACKELKLPVYYIIVEDYGIDDVMRANLVLSSWDIKAFLNLHVSNGVDDYLLFYELMSSYSLSISVLLHAISGLRGIGYRSMLEHFKSGNLDLKSDDKVIELLDSLEMFDSLECKKLDSFMLAYIDFYTQPTFNLEIMKEQCSKFGNRLDENLDRTKRGFAKTLSEKVYSWKVRTQKDKLYYDKEKGTFYVPMR